MLENEELDDDTATDQVDETLDSEEQDDTAGADQLGDAGKRALDAMKAKWRAERDKNRTLAQQIADAAKAKDAEGDKPDLDALRQQARDEVRAESLKERALDKLEAKAAKLFQDPEDARKFLADAVDDFIDGDSVDVQAISDALTDLLEKRPYLGVTQRDEKRFKGTGDQGPKGSAGKPPQVTEAQLKTMTPDQIVKAQKEGRLTDLLGG
jgi:hypothetical protein